MAKIQKSWKNGGMCHHFSNHTCYTCGFLYCLKKVETVEESIAEMYLDLKIDIMMGGGNNYFSCDSRKDKRDLYQEFSKNRFSVVKTKSEMLACDNTKPILGVFHNHGLPYSKDRESSKELSEAVPTLA
jgi:alkaline phosphatase